MARRPLAIVLSDRPVTLTWFVSSPLNTTRYSHAGAGTQTAGLCFGGIGTGSRISVTEEYNGSSWSNGSDITYPKTQLAGVGTQTSALSIAGGADPFQDSMKCEHYNGTSWSYVADYPDVFGGNHSLLWSAAAGTSTSALCFGGNNGQVLTYLNQCYKFNGSSWSSTGSLLQKRGLLGGCGTQSSALSFGGYDNPTNFNNTEEFNGSTWSIGGDLVSVIRGNSGFGVQTSAISCGGVTTSACEQYNGISWITVANMNYSKSVSAAVGSSSAGLSFGGWIGGPSNVTEEYKLY